MKYAVIIPCYKVKSKILKIIKKSIKLFDYVIVVDDLCPQFSGKFVQENIKNEKMKIIFNKKNLGVGGAIKEGISFLKDKDFHIVTKLDGDGQISPNDAYTISKMLYESNFDYANGNRFNIETKKNNIPVSRWYLNKLISIYGKFCLGKYEVQDYLNGLISMKKKTIERMNLEKVRNDFFFESDMIYQTRVNNMHVLTYPIKIKYFKEKSNFKPSNEFFKFLFLYMNRFFKRIYYNYFKKGFFFPTFIIALFLINNLTIIGGSNNLNFKFMIMSNIFLVTNFFISDFYNNKR